jgi:tetratricopeptide (TPR) repeat protein
MKKLMRILFMLAAVATLALAGAGCTAKAKKAYHLSRGNHAYDAGQFESAEIEYRNVLRWDPANSQAFTRLGLIYYDQGRLQRALYFLGKGNQLSPDNPDVQLKLGFIYSSIGQYTQAVAQANFVLDKNPQNDEAPLLLAEGSVSPKDIQTARQRLETMAHNGDRAVIEVALGNLALREHDVPIASAAFKKAQALDANSPAANDGLATIAWAQGDLKQADALFKAAADASPPRSPRRMQYARFKFESGDAAGARTLLEETAKNVPDYLPAMMNLAEISASEKKYDECADWLEKVQKLDENNFDAMFFQGKLDLARGNTDKAVPDMERMARLYSQVPQVYFQLGSAYLAANDLPKAADSFSHALELNPNYVEATLVLAQIQIKNNNPGPAIIALEKVRQKMPRLLQAQLLLADAYRMQDRAGDALGVYQSLENMYPTNAQVVLLHGAALLQLQDKEGARKAFEHALELSPGEMRAIEELVDLDISEKQFDAATELINKKLQAYPKEVALEILQAKVLLSQRKSDQAEAILTQALTMAPDNLSAYLLLGQLYSDRGQNDKALAKVDAVMAKDPKNTTALMLAAKIYESNKDYKGAAEAYEKLLKVDPKYSPALNNLAYLYSEYLNNLDRAYDLAQRARALLPYDPSTADTYGWICYQKGAYQTALDPLKTAAAKLTTTPEVQFHLGMACYMTADEAAARNALQQALQISKDFPGHDECALCLSILDVDPATADAAARAMLEKRVTEKADDPVAHVRLARIYDHDGNADKAAANYEAILQALPQNLDAMVNLTRLYAAKDMKKAYEMAKAASKAAPYNPDVSHTLGRLAYLSGDYQLATSVLQQALQNQPNDASLLFDFAQAAYSIGKVSDAQAAFQNALAQNLPVAQAEQARRILDLMALAEVPAQAASATARIGEVLKAEPNNVPALMARAAASEFNSDVATEEQALEKVLDHYPDFIPAQKRLAWLYAGEPGKLDRAYTLAAAVHDALPDDPEAAKILGAVFVKRGDYNHALSLLKQSVMKMNSDAEAFYYLGNAQFHLKNRVDSKANLQQALALKLSGPDAESAKQMLNELK